MNSPHPASGAELSGDAKDRFVAGLFDRIAAGYDRWNRLLSLGRDLAWRRQALRFAGVQPGWRAVDLGTGTGDLYLLLREAVGPTGSVIGIDVAANMLELARTKAEARFPDQSPDLRQGHAGATGLPDASCDVVTMGWVLRNVGDRQAVYREIQRILAPGGTFLIVEMSQPGFPPLRWSSGVYLNVVMPWLVRWTGGDATAYRYLAESTAAFPSKQELADEWRQAGFEDVAWRSRMLGAIAIHRGRKPATPSRSEADRESAAPAPLERIN